MAGSLIVQPFANSGDMELPPQTDSQGFVNWSQGYTPFYEIDLTANNPQAKAVERPVQNALFNIITANIQAWQQLGFAQWYSGMPGGYSKNAQIVRQNGIGVWVPYRSIIDGNVSDPLTSPNSWEATPKAAEMLANIPMPAGGASGSAGEIVVASQDFNSFGTGTWEFVTDSIAAASPHAPSPLGGATTAGMLESKVWASAPNTYAVQRYTDRNGNSFFRGATNASWTSWLATAPAPTYSADASSVANAIKATFPLTSSVLTDNQQFWVKIAITNTGTATFTPNAAVIAAGLPIIGQAGIALQGGELVAGGRALFVYKADTNNFFLAFCSGSALQVGTAIHGQQAITLDQANSMLAASVSVSAVLYTMGLLL